MEIDILKINQKTRNSIKIHCTYDYFFKNANQLIKYNAFYLHRDTEVLLFLDDNFNDSIAYMFIFKINKTYLKILSFIGKIIK
jgi:hypothetical protein